VHSYEKANSLAYLISLPCELFGAEIFKENWHSFVDGSQVTLGIIAQLQSARERVWIILYKWAKRDSARANGVDGIVVEKFCPHYLTSYDRIMISHSARSQSHDSRGASDIIAMLRSESLPIGIKSDNQAPRLREPLPRRASAPLFFVKLLTGRTFSARPEKWLTRLRNPLVIWGYIHVTTSQRDHDKSAAFSKRGDKSATLLRCRGKCSLALNETLIGRVLLDSWKLLHY